MNAETVQKIITTSPEDLVDMVADLVVRNGHLAAEALRIKSERDDAVWKVSRSEDQLKARVKQLEYKNAFLEDLVCKVAHLITFYKNLKYPDRKEAPETESIYSGTVLKSDPVVPEPEELLFLQEIIDELRVTRGDA